VTEKDVEALEKELSQKVAEFRVLQRVSSRINATLDLDEIYAIALQTMDELFDFHHSIILLLEDDQETLTVVASRGYEGQAIGGKLRLGKGVIGMAAQRRKILHLNNLGQTRAYVAAQRREMVKAGRGHELGEPLAVPGLPNAESQIAIPLMIQDTLIGVFSIESPVQWTFSEHDRELVTIVANQIASAIHNARLYRAEADRLEELRRGKQALSEANERLEQRVRERTLELERKLRVAQEFLHDAKSRVEGPLIGDSAVARALREAVAAEAARMQPLLLVGPPGAGKEAIARAVHDQSPRRDGPFIYVNCPQLQTREAPALLGRAGDGGEAAPGKLELAAGGTLYLEAVHTLPLELQAALSEALAGGGRAGAAADVRVIAATTRDPLAELQRGRLDVRLHQALASRLEVPALAVRREDIPALATYFMERHARQLGRTIAQISDASQKRLVAYNWPGNIRELRGVIERAVLVARGPVLEIAEELLEEAISLGSYRLVERIGSGGMGEVWLAKHHLLARPAAVKLIRAGPERCPDTLVQRFQREAHVTATLRSPNTVQLYDYGVSDGGDLYYVMEHLGGMDLQQLVERFGPLPAERVIMLLVQACGSLAEAHHAGLVHRDIKPANLFVTKLGLEYDFLKVLDFGMVKARLGEDVNLTARGYAQGTPAFMAPELALGEAEVDGRADLYSLGCCAYWLLTGHPVFEAPTPTAMLMQHVQARPIAPSRVSELDVPPALEDAILRCLEKKREARPASALALEDELARIPLATPWTQERARHWWQRHAPEAFAAAV
jgi:DNA-binding NtrC family response regulator/putative methionine-R-sulfoxide reductase with GAF domain